MLYIKGAFCSFGEEIQTQNFHVYNINKRIIQAHKWANKLFLEENKILEHCLELERWQGPPHVHKVKHYEIVLFF